MKRPCVSVVIPTYNREGVIVRAINSVLAQTFSDLELLVVDDASTDNTVQVVQQVDDPRVRILRHETNLFAAAARNTAMKQASGKWIAFLDSDDTWYATKLERQLGVLDQHPEAGFCAGGVLMKQGRGIREKKLLPKLQPNPSQDTLYRFMTGQVHIVTTAFIFRRDLLNTIGYMDVELRRNQDMDFFIRLIQATPGTSIEEPVADFYPNFNPPSLEVVEQSNKRLLEKHKDAFDQLGKFQSSRIWSSYWVRHGQRHIARGRFRDGLSWILKGICKNPFVAPRLYASAAFSVAKRLGRVLRSQA